MQYAAAAAAAQVAVNRAEHYLHPTSVTDARAIWLNPAGPAAAPDASIYVELTAQDPGAAGRLRQITAGFNSRGLSFGYQRDLFDDVLGHTYRVGLAGGAGGLAAGAAIALYRGETRATGWNLGVRYTVAPSLVLGATIANLGEPEVRGVAQPLVLIPGATLTPFGAGLELSTHARIDRRGTAMGYAFSALLRGAPIAPLTAFARLDTDRSLRRAALAFGMALGTRDVLGAVATTPGDARQVDAASVYGLSARRLGR
jgi:hypothetical protein